MIGKNATLVLVHATHHTLCFSSCHFLLSLSRSRSLSPTLTHILAGPTGPAGVIARDGATGAKGNRGTSGSRGEKGTRGFDGNPGLKGFRGDAGSNGANGRPGFVSALGPRECDHA